MNNKAAETTLTAASVSRILAKRHARSSAMSGRVRGYHSTTEGFVARGEGTVRVTFEPGRVGLSSAQERASQDAALDRYMETLRSAGLHAEIVAPNGENALAREILVRKGI